MMVMAGSSGVSLRKSRENLPGLNWVPWLLVERVTNLAHAKNTLGTISVDYRIG